MSRICITLLTFHVPNTGVNVPCEPQNDLKTNVAWAGDLLWPRKGLTGLALPRRPESDPEPATNVLPSSMRRAASAQQVPAPGTALRN